MLIAGSVYWVKITTVAYKHSNRLKNMLKSQNSRFYSFTKRTSQFSRSNCMLLAKVLIQIWLVENNKAILLDFVHKH